MINHVIRSAISRNTQAFSFIKLFGDSRGLIEHKVGPSLLAGSSNGYKGHDFLAAFNAGWQNTGYNPLVEKKSETNRDIEACKEATLETKKVKQARYYNRALGRPNKKTFFAPSNSDHGSTVIAASLSGFPALHQKFLGSVRAFSSGRRTRPTVRMGREFINSKPLRQFTLSKAKSAGRNSAGRITIFHRGGGAKRLQRRIDLKRSTSSMGIVERIEYDPNRSARIALVRWENGVQLNSQGNCKTIEEFATPPRKSFEPTTTSSFASFSFSSMPGKVDQRKVACFSPRQMGTYVTVGLPSSKSPYTSKRGVSRKCSAKEIILSTLSPNATGAGLSFTLDSSSSFPRIAVAGAKPAFYAPRMKENVGGEKRSSPCEIRELTRRSFLGAHIIKRKAAVSWQSLGVTEHNESKLKMDQVRLAAKKPIGDRTPLTYIIASQQLKAGSMVMNCDPSLRP